MAEITAPGSGEAAARATEEAAFYHEAALNASWTGSRLAIGALSFLFGAFAFAYFYLFSSNGHGMWLPSSTTIPSQTTTARRSWPDRGQRAHPDRRPAADQGRQQGATGSMTGARRARLRAWRPWRCRSSSCSTCRSSPASPASPASSSGSTRWRSPSWLSAHDLAGDPASPARGTSRPSPSWSSRPPTRRRYEVQRFQSSLSAFTTVWNYLAIVAFIFWLLFYVR